MLKQKKNKLHFLDVNSRLWNVFGYRKMFVIKETTPTTQLLILMRIGLDMSTNDTVFALILIYLCSDFNFRLHHNRKNFLLHCTILSHRVVSIGYIFQYCIASIDIVETEDN